MHQYRVTIDTMKDQWLYEVNAPSKDGAQQEALSLALGDGMKWGTPHTTKVERLD